MCLAIRKLLGETTMRRIVVISTAMLLTGAFASNVYAQTSRGAANIGAQAQNFTPIEKAACGYVGAHCSPCRS